jgi:hypothetical protein
MTRDQRSRWSSHVVIRRIWIMRIVNVCAGLACAALFSVGAHAAPVNIVSFDNGWYSQNNNSSGDFTAGVSNINVGWNQVTGATYRNWLAFDLSALAGQTVTSATLTFYGNNGTYDSPKTETLGLFDYTGSINALVGNQTGVGIYNDLGTGASYGQSAVSSPLGVFSITLTAAGINALNAAIANASDQRFVIGGSLLSIAAVHDGSNWYNDGQLFKIAGPTSALTNAGYLTVEASQVPLPATLPLFACSLIGGGITAWRKRRRQPA